VDWHIRVLLNQRAIVSNSATVTLLRYIVLALVVTLLAPYAGCHILTSPPSELGVTPDATSPGQQPRESVQGSAPVDLPQDDGGTTTESKQLNDIHQLLSE
jgi:hypothetical protein